MSTVIIDTSCANLNSVRFAFERLSNDIVISDDPAIIRNATRVVLPGVGTAQAAMEALKNKQLVSVIQNLTQPVLGICLGMQLLSDVSDEHQADSDNVTCLGLIPTQINLLNTQSLPSPHMGWNQLAPNSINGANHPLFNNITSNDFVYFVHSYCAPISPYTIAACEYGTPFSAAIAKGNFMGVQFHPEKSAKVGEKILANFLKMTTETISGAV